MTQLLVQNISSEELKAMIREAAHEVLNEYVASLKQPKTELVRRKDAAAMIGVSLPTIDKYSRTGLLHAKLIGGRVYYDKQELSGFSH